MARIAHPKQNPLLERMRRDYDSLDDFYERSKVPLAKESCRRLIYENRRVSPPVVMLIMKYLGFSTKEIKDTLIKDGETEFSSLIGECSVSLTPWEKAILHITKVFKDDSKAAFGQLIGNLELISQAHGLDLAGEIAKLKRVK